ncbi:hypothetical protein VN12_21100 [Pirellula sp. SH-Sr6A]|nr:hypothetical protein VN12_21100 [Pirellula sp. SH-Sr6A]
MEGWMGKFHLCRVEDGSRVVLVWFMGGLAIWLDIGQAQGVRNRPAIGRC